MFSLLRNIRLRLLGQATSDSVRRSLLNSGATPRFGTPLGSYLIYALGEILLVMVGILLALQVNNWNEDRKTQLQIRKQLRNLKFSLESDSESFERTVQVNSFRSQSMEYLLRRAGQSTEPCPGYPTNAGKYSWLQPFPDTSDHTYIETSISWFARGFSNVIIDKSSLDEINNLGLFSEIKNDELKQEIREYYKYVEWIFSDQRIAERVKLEEDLFLYLRDQFGMMPRDISELDDPKAFIKKDTGILVRLKRIKGATCWHFNGAITANQMAENIIAYIESEDSQ